LRPEHSTWAATPVSAGLQMALPHFRLDFAGEPLLNRFLQEGRDRAHHLLHRQPSVSAILLHRRPIPANAIRLCFAQFPARFPSTGGQRGMRPAALVSLRRRLQCCSEGSRCCTSEYYRGRPIGHAHCSGLLSLRRPTGAIQSNDHRYAQQGGAEHAALQSNAAGQHTHQWRIDDGARARRRGEAAA